jgi:hypothetical protein
LEISKVPYSYVQYTGNGSTTNYAFSFPYLDASHIKVRVNGVLTSYTYLNSSTVTISPAPEAGALIDIRRETPKDNPPVDFTDGSVLLESDLDLATRFNLYCTQETEDTANASIALDYTGKFDAQGRRITNVANPLNNQDAATRYYVDSVLVQNTGTFTAGIDTERTIATAGQTVINTPLYVVGNNTLSLFVNGVKLLLGTDYTESSVTTATLVSGLSAGDEIEAQVIKSYPIATIDSNSVSYKQGGTGSSARNVKSKLQETVSVKDFGAIGDGITDDTTAIQNALDSSSGILLPVGTYKISAPLRFNTANFLYGEGSGTVINATHNGAIIRGNAVTPYSGTNVRRYRGGGSNFTITGPGVASTSSIGLDMRGCSQFKWYNVNINNVYTGVRHGDGYATFYNEYHACDIGTVYYGYLNDTLGNENLVVGGRVNACTIGTSDSDCSHNVYIKCAIEVFTTGHRTVAPTSVCIQYISSRLESGTTGILIDASSQDTVVMHPQYQALTTEVVNNGATTIRFDNLGLKTRYGSLISCISKQTVNKAIGPISANSMSQISFTLVPPTGTSFLPGDSVSVTLPTTWPITLIAGQVNASGTNTFILSVYNPTASPVSLAAADYVFTVIKG